MLKQCPACENSTGLEVIRRPDEFDIKGEKIVIDITLYHCNECGKEFGSIKEFDDPLKAAYDEYRRRKRLLQPEEIVAFRNKYNFTQRELSDLLGFGAITLSRYENGALQDQAHDSILKLAMEPHNLIRLISQNMVSFSKEKWAAIVNQIQQELSFIDMMDIFLNRAQPDEFNGFETMQISKIAEVIKYFCNNREVFKTKLMKLLFYSDFIHYKKYNKSITGLRYAHLPYGPVPDGYELILGAVMRTDHCIILEPRDFGKYSGEYIQITESPKLNTFSPSELEVLKHVSSRFEYYTAKAISIKSHRENAYKATGNSELISYVYAKDLNL
jgi:putative zinc finger/helix-turn-helix YgiT family protein